LVADMMDSNIQSVLGEMWQEACEKGSILNFRVQSGSMRPMIEVGDVVSISKVQPLDIRIGDIVAFKDGQNVVVHRIINKSLSDAELIFHQQGDTGGSARLLVAQDIIGKVTSIDKEGRKIRLDSPRCIISNRLMGWRLRLAYILEHMRPRFLSIVLHQTLRPVWKLCRNIMLRRI
jgi:signal peptidase I